MTNIVSLLIENANTRGETVALIEGDTKISYRQLLNHVKIVAAKLERRGISKNNRVLMFIPMSIELYIYILAVWYRGASVVFIDAWADISRIENALSIVPCDAFIGSSKAHLLRVLSKEIRKIKVSLWAVISNSKVNTIQKMIPVETTPGDTALVTFTTGSTGVPKAANRTHGFLLSQHSILKQHMHPRDGDVECICLPVFVLNCLASGNTAFIPPINPAKQHLFKPEKIVILLKKHKCTTIIGSPVFFDKIVTCYSKKNNIPEIRCAFLGGAPVTGSSAKRIIDTFKHTDVEIVYGSTEAEPIAFVKADQLYNYEKNNVSMDGLYAGKPSPHIQIAIVNIIDGVIGTISSDELRKIYCAVNVTGEIVVCGDHVLKEYLNCPEAQKLNKFIVDGTVWHRTGDAGYFDIEGNLHLMGRVQQRLMVNGKEIFPFTVEKKLSICEQVAAGTLIGINNKVYCVIELRDRSEISNREIIDIVGQFGVESEQYIIRTSIPRDPRHQSKIDYDRLGFKVRKYLLKREKPFR